MLSEQLAIVPTYGLGMHTSVYDDDLHDAPVPDLLKQAGIAMLRYPGGGYADIYHWSTGLLTPWGTNGSIGHIANGSDFGSYQSLVQNADVSIMVTIDYGSSLDGTMGGQPQEAAAWVAYANGSPDDPKSIGMDATGIDFKTVGYWATLRASAPQATDDGLNFLRISHPAAIGVEYWEIGNEVFGNGFYDASGVGYSQDLHAPYVMYGDNSARFHNGNLSPTTYGSNVNTFALAMKAVDPSIKIGAVLVTPPMDYSWATYNGRTWNDDVLAQCGKNIDFGIVHWYTGDVSNGVVNLASLVGSPQATIPKIASALSRLFAEYAGRQLDWAVTELGPNSGSISDQQARGLFAADAYVTFMEHGAINVDHLELHDQAGSFLSSGSSVPGPVFYAIRMLHLLANPGDVLVSATPPPNDSMLVAHAALREDNSVGVMLLNMDPNAAITTTVQIDGQSLGTDGTRYDFTRTPSINTTTMSGLGNHFEVTVAPYTITTVLVPAN